MSKGVAKFLAYFVLMFVFTFLFTGMNVLIWWAAQHGFWWSMAAMAFVVAIIGAVMFSLKDPAKIGGK